MELHGHFAADGSFVQTTARTPRPWKNILFNGRFVVELTQTAQGSALSQDAQGHRRDLHEGRGVYVVDVDSGAWWQINGLGTADEGWSCHHGLGHSSIRRRRDGVAAVLDLRLAPGDTATAELWTVTLRNEGPTPRRLRLVGVSACAIGGWFAAPVYGGFDAARNAVSVSDVIRTGTHYAHYTTGERVRAFLTLDAPADGFDTRKAAFIGPYGSLSNPAALERGGCSDSANAFEPSVLALQHSLTLAPGAAATLRFVAGLHDDDAEIDTWRARCFAAPAAHLPAAAPAPARGASAAGGTDTGWRITTPDADFDRFCNGFLQRQLRFNATWARVYYNGFRDLCQDNHGLAAQDPSYAWQRLLTVLRHQYASGFAPRAWIGGGLVEQDYADSPVWIAPAVEAALLELGEPARLDETVPYWDGPAASVRDHVRRSLAWMWADRGAHGLSKIRKGDWNDLLNATGWHGRGESVWLSQALVTALEAGARLEEQWGGEAALAATWRAQAGELRERLRACARVGNVWLRAFTDDGAPLHHPDSPEGMDILPQAWAVLSGCVSGDEARAVLAEVDQRLERPQGLLTCHPGYDGSYRPEVGFLSTVRPGCNVNAGFYQHAGAFTVMADLVAGRAEAGWRHLRKLLPYTDERGHISGEPFVLNNGYYGPAAAHRAGDSDTGWITGTAGWLARIVLEGLCGFRPTRDGFDLRPCLPPGWSEIRLQRRYRGKNLDLRIRADGRHTGV